MKSRINLKILIVHELYLWMLMHSHCFTQQYFQVHPKFQSRDSTSITQQTTYVNMGEYRGGLFFWMALYLLGRNDQFVSKFP